MVAKLNTIVCCMRSSAYRLLTLLMHDEEAADMLL